MGGKEIGAEWYKMIVNFVEDYLNKEDNGSFLPCLGNTKLGA